MCPSKGFTAGKYLLGLALALFFGGLAQVGPLLGLGREASDTWWATGECPHLFKAGASVPLNTATWENAYLFWGTWQTKFHGLVAVENLFAVFPEGFGQWGSTSLKGEWGAHNRHLLFSVGGAISGRSNNLVQLDDLFSSGGWVFRPYFGNVRLWGLFRVNPLALGSPLFRGETCLSAKFPGHWGPRHRLSGESDLRFYFGTVAGFSLQGAVTLAGKAGGNWTLEATADCPDLTSEDLRLGIGMGFGGNEKWRVMARGMLWPGGFIQANLELSWAPP